MRFLNGVATKYILGDFLSWKSVLAKTHEQCSQYVRYDSRLRKRRNLLHLLRAELSTYRRKWCKKMIHFKLRLVYIIRLLVKVAYHYITSHTNTISVHVLLQYGAWKATLIELYDMYRIWAGKGLPSFPAYIIARIQKKMVSHLPARHLSSTTMIISKETPRTKGSFGCSMHPYKRRSRGTEWGRAWLWSVSSCKNRSEKRSRCSLKGKQ